MNEDAGSSEKVYKRSDATFWHKEKIDKKIVNIIRFELFEHFSYWGSKNSRKYYSMTLRIFLWLFAVVFFMYANFFKFIWAQFIQVEKKRNFRNDIALRIWHFN